MATPQREKAAAGHLTVDVSLANPSRKPSNDTLASASGKSFGATTVSIQSPVSAHHPEDDPPNKEGHHHHQHRQHPYDTDVEMLAGITSSTRNSCQANATRKSISCTGLQPTDCQVWPGHEHWRNKAKVNRRRNRGTCNCMAHLSRRTRIIVRVLIIAVFVGAAVGVGLGISRYLGAPIWQPPQQ